MPDGIKLEADFSELYAAKRWLHAFVGKKVRDIVNMATLELQRHIKQDLFQSYSMIGPKNRGVLNSRSGELKRNITAQPATVDGDMVTGKLGIGTKYGKVMFGKAGQSYHIVPKNAGALTIPLPAALNSSGEVRGAARDKAIFGQTFLAKSKAGNMIIFGKLNYVRGAKAGQAKGDIVPLFVLKQSVDVPVQITTESLRAFVQPILGKGMQEIREGLENSTVAG